MEARHDLMNTMQGACSVNRDWDLAYIVVCEGVGGAALQGLERQSSALGVSTSTVDRAEACNSRSAEPDFVCQGF